jgi:hypothetical protein
MCEDAVVHRGAEGGLTDVRRATGVDEVEGGGPTPPSTPPVEGGVGGGDSGTESGCILMVVLGLNAGEVLADHFVSFLVARPGDVLLDGVECCAGAGCAKAEGGTKRW